MSMRITSTLVLFVLFTVNLNAQEYELGIVEGTNYNIVSLRSDYDIRNYQTYPVFSKNVGVSFRAKKGKKFKYFSIEYYRLSNKVEPDFILTDITGFDIGIVEQSIVLHNININGVFSFYAVGGFFLGAGAACNFNVASTLKLRSDINDYNGKNIGNTFPVNYMRDFTVSVPFMFGFSFYKFDLIFKFDKGIMNRLDGDGFVDEINNTLSINVNYRIFEL